jgi:hypothetical protein
VLTPATVQRTIKALTKRLVEACGGQESCALIPGIRVTRHQAYSEFANDDYPDKRLPLDVLAMMTIDSGSKVFAEWLAGLTGHAVVRLPVVAPGASINRVTGQAMRETAEVFEHLGKSLEDGVLDRLEGKDVNTQIDESIEKLLELKALINAHSDRGEE